MEWLKAHWVWVAGIVGGLWLLSKLLANNSSVGANVSTPSGVAVTYGGTNANDAAIQVAQINAQSAAASAQVAGNQAVLTAQVAQQANADTQAANMHIADTQAAAALAITNSNNVVALRVTDNQTTLGLAQVAGARDVAMLQSNNALTLGLDNNRTNLAAYGIQANVVNNQTAALTQIALAQTSANEAIQTAALGVQSQALANQSQLIGATYQLEASGQFNKGGEGGVNQVAAWGALTNPGSAAAGDAAAAATAVGSSNQISSIISSIGGAVSKTLGAVTGLTNSGKAAAAAA